jgi:hypothetical protein
MFLLVPYELNPMENQNETEKWNRAVSLFMESVLKPDHELRQCAHNQKCYHELMYVRETILEHLKTLRR